MRTPGARALLAPYDRERQLGIEYYVRLAAGSRPDAILVILDADDECHDRQTRHPYQPLGPELLERATGVIAHIPVGVVVTFRMYMRKKSGSFDKLVRELERLTAQARLRRKQR